MDLYNSSAKREKDVYRKLGLSNNKGLMARHERKGQQRISGGTKMSHLVTLQPEFDKVIQSCLRIM